MNVGGITWHAMVLDQEQFTATRKLMIETLGLEPAMEMEGWCLFGMSDGSALDLFTEETAESLNPWGLNDGVAFGFRVDDIESASSELEAAGCELLGDIVFVEQFNYSWRHYRGPDGRVYGINQQH